MTPINAFFKLIRWPNLAFTLLTQCLFYFFVCKSVSTVFPEQHFLFFLLVLASVCIAAAGYIINDYFDIYIDALNKPQKVVINRYIKRRWAIIWHIVLSALGLLLSAYIGYKARLWYLAPANLAVVLLLWFYSTTFKRQNVTGNVIIALLTAWVIGIVYVYADHGLHNLGAILADEKKLFKFMVIYAGFAFITTLIREAIKDLEDMKGDAALNCTTMPIKLGVPAAKVYIHVWIVVAVAALLIILFYASLSGWWPLIAYTLVFIVAPMGWLFSKLTVAETFKDYEKLSSVIKAIMLAGILSMVFFVSLIPH